MWNENVFNFKIFKYKKQKLYVLSKSFFFVVVGFQTGLLVNDKY